MPLSGSGRGLLFPVPFEHGFQNGLVFNNALHKKSIREHGQVDFGDHPLCRADGENNPRWQMMFDAGEGLRPESFVIKSLTFWVEMVGVL